MGALTEREIFDRMSASFRIAAECCDKLVVAPAAGPVYDELRQHLRLIEGCCRQAAHWREDARWLPLGLEMAEAHRRAGEWLRRRYARRVFGLLASKLREGQRAAEALRDRKPPKLGLILPAPQRDPTERPALISLPEMPHTVPNPGGALLGTTAMTRTKLVMP